jgi:alkanesulfonate monooxygenase SsuD/methylene tetrahydromethanopterin reductase-like flavin-dependent oxidoreductase (luciferase family)
MTDALPGIGVLGNVGISVPELVKLGAEIEQAGFPGVWVIEYEYDSIALAQAIAQGTSTVMTGTCITRAFTRHPISLATTAAAIDQLAPGRFTIGLGSGALESADPKLSLQRWGVPWDRSAARMKEYVEVLRRALDGETLGYQGDFYDLNHVELELLPEKRVPIFLAGGGKRMMDLAGSLSDGVFMHMVDEQATRATRERVAAAAEKHGRDPGELDVSNLIMTCVDDDRATAVAAMKHWLVEYYLSMKVYQSILAENGWADEGKTILDAYMRGDKEAAEAAVPDGLIEHFTITGTPDECRQKLAEFVSWGTTMPILYVFPSRGDWRDAYRRTIDTFAGATAAG